MIAPVKLPSNMYLVIADFPAGLGSEIDPTGDREEAYQAYLSAYCDHRAVRVLLLSFDVETNAPETTTDITAEFAERHQGEDRYYPRVPRIA